MYSYFSHEDIEVLDKEGLKSFLKDWAKANPNWWLNGEMEDSISSEKFSFDSWTELKLISYWNIIDTAFLNCIAKYLEGDVYWTFENDDETGSVRFEDGKCIITTGGMQYTEVTPKEMIGGGIDDLNKKTKRLMVLSNL